MNNLSTLNDSQKEKRIVHMSKLILVECLFLYSSSITHIIAPCISLPQSFSPPCRFWNLFSCLQEVKDRARRRDLKWWLIKHARLLHTQKKTRKRTVYCERWSLDFKSRLKRLAEPANDMCTYEQPKEISQRCGSREPKRKYKKRNITSPQSS